MVGNYGGDIDNFSWPRHSGDWAFFRAYVNEEGNPAPFSAENVPLTTPDHLTISTAGVDPGDFLMVAGYPYRTSRYRTAEELAAESVRIPWVIEIVEDMIAIFEQVGSANEEARVRIAPLSFGYRNYLKYEEGVRDGFVAGDLVTQAREQENTLQDWLTQENQNDLLENINALDVRINEHLVHAERNVLLRWMMRQTNVLRTASTLYWLAGERLIEDDLTRMEGYQERDWDQIAARIARMEQTFVADVDERILAYMLRRAQNLPETEHIEAIDTLLARFATNEDPAAAAAAALMQQTSLTSPEARNALLSATPEEFTSSEDPIIEFMLALDPLRRQIYQDNLEFEGAMSRLRPAYTQAIEAMADRPIYPDANGTLRITFGHVQGYPGADAVWYQPFTTIEGIIEKHTDQPPFDAPDQLLAAIENELELEREEASVYFDTDLRGVPVNFTSTMDTTGGNSGSATLNARGELCGLLFDGNYESMASDWAFEPVRTRSIHTDIRYVLWYMENVDQAFWILREVGIEPN